MSCCLLLVSTLNANTELPIDLKQGEWQVIQAKIKESQYQPQQSKQGSYQAVNHQHGFRISYGIDGTTTLRPYQTDDYRIGMRLTTVGSSQVSKQPISISVNDNKLSYHWNDTVEEFWINSTEKLEQWFTIQNKPLRTNVNDDLVLTIAIDTNLQIVQQGNQLTFSGQGKHITYDKFKVWDANNRRIAAEMELSNNLLNLRIVDRDAVYPLAIDPSFTQQAYIKASNADTGDRFGYSLALNSNTLAVGAYLEASNANEINGDENNNNAIWAGAVYIFTHSDGVWSQQAYIKPNNIDPSDWFGWSVALEGDTLVVGSIGEASSSTGVNNNENNNSANDSGAVYVFVRNNGVWFQQAYIKASNTGVSDRFGYAVALDNDTLAISAYLEDSGATGVDGNQNDNSASDSGAVYVFTRNNNIWLQQAYIKASNTEQNDWFGHSVSLNDNILAVGANQEDSNSTGVNNDDINNNALNSGAVYIFTRNGNMWSQSAYIKASNTETFDGFGRVIALSNDSLVVGARGEDSNAIGIDGDQNNNSANNAGAVYMFTQINNTWVQKHYIKASNTEASDNFGVSVALHDDRLIVGAIWEDSNATGVDGNQQDNSISSAGAVYLFKKTNNFWVQQNYIKASNNDVGDSFGESVAVDDNFLIVGSYQEDSNAIGINGNQDDNSANNAGAVYVFINSYLVGGTVSGLVGSGLTLQNNGGGDIVIDVNGAYTFPMSIVDNENYFVIVAQQPSNPNQICSVVNGNGVISGADVNNVNVICLEIFEKIPVFNRFGILLMISLLLILGLYAQRFLYR